MGPQWSGDRAQKKRTGRRRAKMMQRGLRMASGKFRRRELYHSPSVSIVVLFSLLLNRIFIFCDLNV